MASRRAIAAWSRGRRRSEASSLALVALSRRWLVAADLVLPSMSHLLVGVYDCIYATAYPKSTCASVIKRAGALVLEVQRSTRRARCTHPRTRLLYVSQAGRSGRTTSYGTLYDIRVMDRDRTTLPMCGRQGRGGSVGQNWPVPGNGLPRAAGQPSWHRRRSPRHPGALAGRRLSPADRPTSMARCVLEHRR